MSPLASTASRALQLSVPLGLAASALAFGYLHARVTGGELGSERELAVCAVLTFALLDGAVLLVLKAMGRSSGQQLAVPPLVAGGLLSLVGLASLGRGTGLVDVRPIHLLLLPAYGVLSAAQSAGLDDSEGSTGLTAREAMARGFRFEVVGLAAAPDGTAAVVARVSARRPSSPVVGRSCRLDGSGAFVPAPAERESFSAREQVLAVAAADRVWLLDARGSERPLREVSANGVADGPPVTNATALAVTAGGQAWVARERDRWESPREPAVGAELLVLRGGRFERVLTLPRLPDDRAPEVLALRMNDDGTGALVAKLHNTNDEPERVWRAEVRGAVLGPAVPLEGDGTARAAALDASGRAVVSRILGARDLTRYLPDGRVDSAFAPAELPFIEAVSLEDDGHVWLVTRKSALGALDGVARLLPDGAVDPGFANPFGAPRPSP